MEALIGKVGRKRFPVSGVTKNLIYGLLSYKTKEGGVSALSNVGLNGLVKTSRVKIVLTGKRKNKFSVNDVVSCLK